MGGYTPAFASIYSGTLYGRWPTAAVWASLLPLIDSRGQIELSYEAISGMTGWPLKLLRLGIEALTSPDPDSSSKLEEGRRLVLIDPARPWGWRAVNFQKYRDKASGVDQVSDGRNALKVRRYKERHRRTPEDTGGNGQTPTHTHTHTQTGEKKPERAHARGDLSLEGANPRVLGTNPRAKAEGLNPEAWQRWFIYRRDIRKPIRPASILAAQQKLAAFGAEQGAVVEQSIANGWQGLFPLTRDATKTTPPARTWRPGPEDSGPC